MVNVIVNGEPRSCGEGATVRSLLRALGLPETRVAVERNRALVRRTDYEDTALSDGDRIEIVTFVGGG